MKKIILAFVLFPVLLTAQKVKVKKDDVYIDKVLVGTIVKTKDSLKNKLFTYSDVDGNPLVIYKYETLHSPIEGEEEVYAYNEVTIPSLNIVAGLDIKNEYSQTRKKVVPYFIEKGILNKDGSLNKQAAQSYYETVPEIPLEITAMYNQELEEMNDLDFIEERDMTAKPYLVFKNSSRETIPYINMISNNNYILDTYDIKQGDVVIGKMITRFKQALTSQPGQKPGKTGDPIVFFYNNKGGRVATAELGFTELRVHRYKWKLGRIKHTWLKEENKSKLYKEIAGYLVDKKAL
ncbi:hypothetical protein [uncultured Dokdonia sp.]|uniref:hypothetical protein n=1 Tax=uncultured Dokdonia sp. TaxID=575653 RepID=UPI00263511E2|nr:hypothetical protein [uncultured Dokdonia sp.]